MVELQGKLDLLEAEKAAVQQQLQQAMEEDAIVQRQEQGAGAAHAQVRSLERERVAVGEEVCVALCT